MIMRADLDLLQRDWPLDEYIIVWVQFPAWKLQEVDGHGASSAEGCPKARWKNMVVVIRIALINNANAPSFQDRRFTHLESFAFLTTFHIFKPISFVLALFASPVASLASAFAPDTFVLSLRVTFLVCMGGGAGDADLDCASSGSIGESLRRFLGPSMIFAWSIPGPCRFFPTAEDADIVLIRSWIVCGRR